MHDDDDDVQPRDSNELPPELSTKLFDYSDPALPAVRYPGRDLWPARQVMGAESGFTEWTNPTDRKVRMILNLGPDAQLHVGFEMSLIPARHRISRGEATERLRGGRALRREYCMLLVEIPPGESLALPAEYDRAIRTVKNGVVQGGHAPFLLKKGEATPPQLHPSLLAEDAGPTFAHTQSAAARRRQ